MSMEVLQQPSSMVLLQIERYCHGLSQLDHQTRRLLAVEWQKAEREEGPLAMPRTDLTGARYQNPLHLSCGRDLELSVALRLAFNWRGMYAVHRVGGIPVPVVLYKGLVDGEVDPTLSASNPALVVRPADGSSLTVLLHHSIPKAVIDAAAFHELRESELYYLFSVPRDVAHRVAAHQTSEYARNNFSSKEQLLFATFQAVFTT